MKLVCTFFAPERISDNYVTDLTVFEFLCYLKAHAGEITITYVQEISAQEAQRWTALGYKTLLQRNIPR